MTTELKLEILRAIRRKRSGNYVSTRQKLLLGLWNEIKNS